MHRCMHKNASACFYGFEANPAFTHTLTSLEILLRSKGIHVRLFTSTAFSTNDRGATFYVEPERFNTSAVGSTLDGTKPLTFKDAKHRWHTDLNASVKDHYTPTHVRTVNAANFLAALVNASDFVALKLDIEGFEYTLLPNLIYNAPAAMCRLSLLATEWHMKPGDLYRQTERYLIKSYLQRGPNCNVTLLDWK